MTTVCPYDTNGIALEVRSFQMRGSLRGAFISAREKEMTKADLVEEIAKEIGISKKDTSVIVNLIIENVSRALAEGGKVELRGFGSFKVKSRNPRKARNPRTGESVDVPAKLVPYFKASNELKAKINR